MLGRVKVNFMYKDLIENKHRFSELKPDVNDFYGLVFYLIDNAYLFVCGTELMYCDEIRFDYKNRDIYIPYVHSEYMPIKKEDYSRFEKCGAYQKYQRYSIGYKNEIRKYMVFSGNSYVEERIYVVREEEGEVKGYYIDLREIPLRDTTQTCKEARDLFIRYIAYSYGLYMETDTALFYDNKKMSLTHTEKRILKEFGLEFNGAYVDLEYTDVRQYKLDELRGKFTDQELMIGLSLNRRRLRFEAELFTRCAIGDLWYNWTKGDMDKLKMGKGYFIKYKEREIYLIFKKEWIKGDGK